MTQATQGIQDATLHRNAWRALAVLAEQRQDEAAAAEAYKRAAQAVPFQDWKNGTSRDQTRWLVGFVPTKKKGPHAGLFF